VKKMKRSKFNIAIALLGAAFWMFLLAADPVMAQESVSGVPPTASKLNELLTPKTELPTTTKTVFEGPVDPETFQLGPGDLLIIFLWRPTVTQFPVRINAEGEAVIPTVGPVKVTGMTLSAAKEAITRKVRERFSGAELTVSLDEVRQFRTHVCGAVPVPGTYLVPATARVADAILLAGGLLRRPHAEWDTTLEVVASQRRIQIFPSQTDKSPRAADLLLFERAGDTKGNPYLQDGDVIWVPLKEESPSAVGVYGGVALPGLFEYVPGDRAANLVKLAAGALPSAKLSESYLVRADGQRVTVGDPFAQEVEVRPGDRFYVPIKYKPQQFGSVTVEGEVAKPGGYPVEIGKTTVRQVLEAAGGLLPTAAANSARMVREPPDFRDAEKGRLLRPRNLRGPLDETTFDVELRAAYERWMGTTVVLDLSERSKVDESAEDVVLQDGDVLEIPKQPLGIRMFGCVNESGEIAYHDDWSLGDYLKAAGGVSHGGWKSQTRVVKASTGSVVPYSSKVHLDPGDIVFVPSKVPATTWTQIKDGVSVVSQVATIALIIITASK
jgi:protein involved in polysaccharide export with SLBB domain